MNKHIVSRLILWLRSAIWNDEWHDENISIEEYDHLMQIAKRQAVRGLVAQVAVEHKNELSSKILLVSDVVMLKLTKNNDKINRLTVEISQALTRGNIDHVLVKGPTLAPLYPVPNARETGDIDIYVAKKDQSRVAKVLKEQLDVYLPPYTEGKHVNCYIEDITIEIHKSLTDLHAPWHIWCWNKIIDQEMRQKYYVKINNQDIPTLNPTTSTLYTFIHFYYHFITLGCGIRQIVDLAVMMNAYKDEIDYNRLKCYLKKLGLFDGFCAIGWIMLNILNMPKESFPYEIKLKHKKPQTAIMKDIIKGGNFGNYRVRKDYKPGILHTMQTFKIMTTQALMLWRLTPVESLWLVPSKAVLHMKIWFNIHVRKKQPMETQSE